MNQAPPHNIEAERSVLGAAMKSPSAVDEIAAILPNENAFYLPKHREIYKAMLGLQQKGKPVDIVTMADALGDSDLTKIGGRTYLTGLEESVAATANSEYYAKIVAKKAHLRQLMETAEHVREEAAKPGAEPEAIADLLEGSMLSSTTHQAAKIHDIADMAPDFAKVLLGEKKDVDRKQLIETRIPELNVRLGGGLHRGHLVVIGGLPSMGKSSLSVDTVLYNGNFGKRSLIFSIDEPIRDVIERAFQANLGLDKDRITRGGPWEDSERLDIESTADALSQQPWSVIDASGMTALQIRSHSRAYKRKHGQLDIVVIDYIGQITPAKRSGSQTRERDMAEISMVLKETAKELDCCVIAISQLNRTATNEPMVSNNDKSKRRIPKPRMSHLKDSGAIEADANVVLLPFLPSEYLKERLGEHHEWTRDVRGDDSDTIPAEIIVGKNKMGPKCAVPCRFHQKRMQFYSPVPVGQVEMLESQEAVINAEETLN